MLVGLAAPLGTIGTARLVVIGKAGGVRSVTLPGIQAGTKVLDPNTSRFRIQTPALAIDPGEHHAAVIPASGPVSVVDLRTLEIVKHVLAARAPAAAAKNVEGTTRTAVWTWAGTIAVAGRDASGDAPESWKPAGLTLIDTGTWTTTVADTRATDVLAVGAGAAIVSWGTLWDGNAQKSVGDGLNGYDANGTRRFHLFAGEPITIAALVGKYAYLASTDFMHFRVVDTVSGRVLSTPSRPRTTTLAEP
jgi:hypothetical protein